jgi:hypothetical protein
MEIQRFIVSTPYLEESHSLLENLDLFASFLAIYTFRRKDMERDKIANYDTKYKLVIRKLREG